MRILYNFQVIASFSQIMFTLQRENMYTFQKFLSLLGLPIGGVDLRKFQRF